MRLVLSALILLLVVGCGGQAETVRFATFNASLSKDQPGELLETMRAPDDPQAKAVAAILQAARPDVLLLQEFDHGPDYDPDGQALRLFQQNYLAVPQGEGLEPIAYEHVYLAPSNTGIPTGVDLNGDGIIAPAPGAELGTEAYAADCHGWGNYPGHYAFVILSKYPIDREGIRTFQEFLWKDLPGNQMPEDYYSEETLAVLRLSSKNHVVVPIHTPGRLPIGLIAAHPTPPVFDGPDDSNGRRNYDELQFLASVIAQYAIVESGSDPLYGDGSTGFRPFVAAGDLNADPLDGEAFLPGEGGEIVIKYGSLWREHGETLIPRGVTFVLPSRSRNNALPTSAGGTAATERDGGVNAQHHGAASADTADWNDAIVGNLRVDYVIPWYIAEITASGVFWPTPEEPLMGVGLATVERASDHRLVWVDVKVD